MKIFVADYADRGGGLVEKDVPDEPVRKFLEWVMGGRFRLDGNPEITVDKVRELRAGLHKGLAVPTPALEDTAERPAVTYPPPPKIRAR